VAPVRCGYLTPDSIRKPEALARALEDRFDDIRVGVHDGVDVVFGHDWLGPVSAKERPRIAHVLTSTLAAGAYGHVTQARGGTLSVFNEDSVEVFAAPD